MQRGLVEVRLLSIISPPHFSLTMSVELVEGACVFSGVTDVYSRMARMESPMLRGPESPLKLLLPGRIQIPSAQSFV